MTFANSSLRVLFIIYLSTFLTFSIVQAQEISIIPKPLMMQKKPGKFAITSNTFIHTTSDVQYSDAQIFSDMVYELWKIRINVIIGPVKKKKRGDIYVSEAYPEPEDKCLLTVYPNKISLSGTGSGNFYGFQSIIQMATYDSVHKVLYVPCVQITDYPRFKWRGLHLDVCRHFFPVSFIKKYIDLLALHKMNSFHWHLTEDQGWRIEIKKYPKLTEIGAWRNGSMVGPYNEHKIDSIRYGGSYTQEEIKDVVEYARKRHITIIPEIEMPGHSLAALAAYPQYSCTGGPFEVAKEWGVFDDVYCAGNDSTFIFLTSILDEVMALFPSKYIHIGGDECPKTRWKTCSKCQERIKKEGLKDENELQSYFVQRIEKHINSKGRQMIGWDEILEGGLAPNAAVMSWRGVEGGIAAAKAKHNVIMSPGSHCYFDHYQGPKEEEPLAIGGFTTTEKVYNYEPIPAEFSFEESRYILGAQGNVWTEYITTPEQVEYMTYPRACALAEVLWTNQPKRNYKDFEKRLNKHTKLLDKLDVNYRKRL